MILKISEEQKEIAKLAYDFAVKTIKPIRSKWDENEEFPIELIGEMRKMDLFGLWLPEELGGVNQGITSLCAAIEQMSRVCAGISLPVATSALGSIGLFLYATKEQREKWMKDIARGDKLAAFALTEAEAGSDAASIKTTARKEARQYVLSGVKHFCSSGSISDLFLVFASTNPQKGPRGITAFLVEKGTPGFKIGRKEKKLGIKSNPTTELVFENCIIPAENIIYAEGRGLFVLQDTFDYSRPGVAAQALGIAQGALDETIPYLKNRRQFGQSVMSFQSISHKVAELAAKLEAARSLVYSTVAAMDREFIKAANLAVKNGTMVKDELRKISRKRWTKYSAMCKLFASDVAFEITQECINLCGGIGYMRDFPVEKFMRDAKVTQIYEGTNHIQKNEIAAQILKEY